MVVRVLRHYVPLSLVALGFAEALIFFGAMYLGVAARFAGVDLSTEAASEIFPIFSKALVFALVMLGTLLAFGLYQRENQQNELSYTVCLIISFLTGLLIMMIIFYTAPAFALGRGAFGLTVLFAFTGVLTARAVFLRLADHGAFRRRILVLGTGTRAAKVAELEKVNGCGEKFHVVGYLPLNGTSNGVDSAMILRESGSLQTIAMKYDVDEIVVGVRDRRCGDMPMNDLLERKMGGTSVIDLPTFFERETGCVRLESLSPSWLIFSDGFRIGTIRGMAKRAFDVALASVLLLLTLPIMVLTATLIWLESGMPIFYRQDRVGAFGRRFKLLKFRSMRADAEADGTPRWATENDERCTRVGRIIRQLRIDELPQIINVLKGEMSFVGPRPERPFFVDDLAKNLKYYPYRHTVKPGITGWAQIRYHYGASMNDAKEKLQYDLYYVKNQSLFLDLVILAQTAHIVLLGKGAR
ncbi:MAG: TIGR03013 family XrtA/PEP-CTERM system glycosyltransferase [Acidiferrobacterales bacterium]